MIKTALEKVAEDYGFDISQSDDIVQANLLNGLGKGFATYNDRELGMQMCYVEQKLTPQAKKFLKELVEFIKLSDNV
jgi:hypothetical protein